MNSNTYTPPQKKEVTSVALEMDVRKWLDTKTTNRSHFINMLLRKRMERELRQRAQQIIRVEK